MEKLKELIAIADRQKTQAIEVIGKTRAERTLLEKLYNAVHDKKILDDDDAVRYLYEEYPNRNAYYKLKHTLKNRLLNTLLLIEPSKQNTNERVFYLLKCQKKTTALNCLVAMGVGRKSAVWLAKKILKEATYWRFTEIVIATCRFLCNYHAGKTGNLKLFQQYSKLLDDYMDLYIAEVKAESLYADFVSHYVNNKATKKHLYHLAEKHTIELEGYQPQIQSARLLYLKAMLHIAKHMSVNDYHQTVSVCDKTITALKKLDYFDTRAMVVINFQLVACCIQLKHFDRGKAQVAYLFEIQKKKIFNWFKTNELYFNLCMHTQHYQKGWQVFFEVRKHKSYRRLPKSIQEIWNIYEAWLNYLLVAGKIKKQDQQISPDQRFRVGKFLNEVEVFSKDKKGLNISITIIFLLLLVQQKRYDLLLDKTEAIEKYGYRYLNQTETKRSYFFLKMLLLIPKHHFHRNRVNAKAQVYFTQLKNTPISDQSFYIEVVPYEYVWPIVLDSLLRRPS